MERDAKNNAIAPMVTAAAHKVDDSSIESGVHEGVDRWRARDCRTISACGDRTPTIDKGSGRV